MAPGRTAVETSPSGRKKRMRNICCEKVGNVANKLSRSFVDSFLEKMRSWRHCFSAARHRRNCWPPSNRADKPMARLTHRIRNLEQEFAPVRKPCPCCFGTGTWQDLPQASDYEEWIEFQRLMNEFMAKYKTQDEWCREVAQGNQAMEQLLLVRIPLSGAD